VEQNISRSSIKKKGANMKLKKMIVTSVACLIAIALSGCSREPSSADIEKAIRAYLAHENQQAKNYGGFIGSMVADMVPKIYGIRKIGCAPAQGSSGYNCDVEIDASREFPGRGRSKNVAKFRFIKGSDGWLIAQ
jgi:hypothetical protein